MVIDPDDPKLSVPNALRFLVPLAALFLLFCLNVVTVPVLNSESLQVPFLLMGIYYWSIYRPTLVPSWLLFVVGIGLDALVLTPIGYNALIFILTHKIVSAQRRYLMGQPFVIIWLGYSLVYTLSFSGLWTLYYLNDQAVGFTLPMAISSLLSCLVFPVLYLLLHTSHRILPAPNRQQAIALEKSRLKL